MEFSRRKPHSSTDGHNDAAHQFEVLFGDRLGTVVIALGANGRFTASGRYDVQWSEHHFNWPSDRRKVLRFIETHKRDVDVYFRATLRAAVEPSKLGSCLGSSFVWADLDHVTPERRNTLVEALLSDGSMVVHSGSEGHLQPYLRLDGVYPAEVIEALNHLLATVLGGDSKWAENSVLRVAGTYNHKQRAKGQKSRPVELEQELPPSNPPWSPEALRRTLEALLPEEKHQLGVGRSGNRRRPGGGLAEIVLVEPEEFELSELSSKARNLIGGSAPGRSGDRSRSGQLFALIAQLMTDGMTDGQIVAIARYSEPGQGKWETEHDLRVDIQRCTEKLRPSHDHAGQNCASAGCRNLSNPRVVTEIEGFRSLFYERYKPVSSRTLATDARVLDALCNQALITGKTTIDISLRNLCNLSGIANRDTAADGLKRLRSAGYLVLVRRRSGSGIGQFSTKANRYRLLVSVDKPGPHDHVLRVSGREEMECGPGSSLLDPNLDIWTFGALGSARTTYWHLCHGKTTAAEIADAVDGHRRTISRHLLKLQMVGLAERHATGKWVPVHRSPDDVAADLGVLGRGEQRAARRAAESRQFREFVDQIHPDYDSWVDDWRQRGYEPSERHAGILVPKRKISRDASS